MTDGVTPPRTVAVVLNYRTADDTIRSVRALCASTLPPSSIIVVDNASDDDSAVRIADAIPGVGFIQQPVNRGFSGGCNAGIREALRRGAERVLLLNADAVVQPAALGAMHPLLESDPALGIIGPIVVSRTQPAHVESFGISFSRTTGRMWNQECGRPLSAIERPERRDVDAVSGCAMLIARAVFERIGLFDEEYFFGFEDVDFCVRARGGEFRVAVAGNAVVEHEGHASIGRRSAQRIYFATRNHLRLTQRDSGPYPIWARPFRTSSVLILNLAHVVHGQDVSRVDGFREFLRGACDHFAGRYGAPSSGASWPPSTSLLNTRRDR